MFTGIGVNKKEENKDMASSKEYFQPQNAGEQQNGWYSN
jgi:hypothetical protein